MTDNRTTELLPCPFCGKDDKLAIHHRKTRHYDGPLAAVKCNRCGIRGRYQMTDARAIAAWNTRAELGSENCAICAEDMGRYADSLCDPLKERIAELLRCLENDWNIRASWDGLRKFWCIELTEEGVRLRDAELNSRAERTCRNNKDKWSGLAKYLFVCSECGWNIVDVGNDAIDLSARLMKRCPMCGAKVMVE